MSILHWVGRGPNFGTFASLVMKPQAIADPRFMRNVQSFIFARKADTTITIPLDTVERILLAARSGELRNPEVPLELVFKPERAVDFVRLFLETGSVDVKGLDSYLICLGEEEGGVDDFYVMKGKFAFLMAPEKVIASTADFTLDNDREVETLCLDSTPRGSDTVLLPLYVRAIQLAFKR